MVTSPCWQLFCMHTYAGCIHQDLASVIIFPLQRSCFFLWSGNIPFLSAHLTAHCTVALPTPMFLYTEAYHHGSVKKTLQIFLGKKEKPWMTTVRPNNGLDFTKSAQRLLLPLCATSSLMQDFSDGRLTHSAPDFSLSLQKRCQFKIIWVWKVFETEIGNLLAA